MGRNRSVVLAGRTFGVDMQTATLLGVASAPFVLGPLLLPGSMSADASAEAGRGMLFAWGVTYVILIALIARCVFFKRKLELRPEWLQWRLLHGTAGRTRDGIVWYIDLYGLWTVPCVLLHNLDLLNSLMLPFPLLEGAIAIGTWCNLKTVSHWRVTEGRGRFLCKATPPSPPPTVRVGWRDLGGGGGDPEGRLDGFHVWRLGLPAPFCVFP